MANEQNLQPVRSKSEAREKGRKGGKASGVSRRRHKTMQETVMMILKQPMDDIGLNKAKRSGVSLEGIDEYDLTAMTGVVLGQVRSAANGNSQAAQNVAEWLDLSVKHKRENIEIEKKQAEIEKLKAEIDRLRNGSGGGSQDNEFLNAWKQSIIDGYKDSSDKGGEE